MTDEVLADLRQIFSPTTKKEALNFALRVHHRLSKAEALLVPSVVLAWVTRPAIMDLIRLTTTTDYMPAEELHQLELPVRIVCGASDKILPPNSVAYFRKHLPHAIIEEPQGMGHCPHQEHPIVTARLIRKFSESLVS